MPRSDHLIELQGKAYCTYGGLLELAHERGLSGIVTELIQAPTAENGNTAIMRASVTVEAGTFTGYGDADPKNVNRAIGRHLLRMAETRAKARALRDAVNVGVTAIEELGGGSAGNDDPQPPSLNERKRRVMAQVADARKGIEGDLDTIGFIRQIADHLGVDTNTSAGVDAIDRALSSGRYDMTTAAPKETT